MLKIALFEPDIALNVGTIMRLSACMNTELHIIEPCGFVFDMQKIKRSAMDYISHVKLFRHDCFSDFYENQISNHPENRLILLTTKSQNSYTDFKFTENDILLFGRESAGVPPEVAELAHHKLTIKMQNKMRSLNVAISVAMVVGESIRQVSQ